MEISPEEQKQIVSEMQKLASGMAELAIQSVYTMQEVKRNCKIEKKSVFERWNGKRKNGK